SPKTCSTGRRVIVIGDDRQYMEKALELAACGTGLTFPNPLVGAVIVSGGEIAGEGFHSCAGKPHAEIEAIASAGERAKGADLYLNLEPCCHHGRTPPCTDAIVEAGIARVVFGIFDPDERVRGKGASQLRENGIEVVTGVMAREALELNLPYVHRLLTGGPFVLLKLAVTLDGRITLSGEKYITCSGSLECVHGLRAKLEAIAVGSGTFRADYPSLDRRLFERPLDPPIRMVFDSGLNFPSGHPWLKKGERVILYCSEEADAARIEELEEAGAEIARLPHGDGGLDLGAWRRDLSRRGITSVLVEGGARIATSMIMAGIPDRLVLFHAPLIAGAGEKGWYGDEEPPAFGELDLSYVEVIDGDVMTVYDRKHVSG
ncbi:MAG: bifunctional diaminohydroxyphosphoribosylaminopyrimidine deaminase/5-amino-6-(5-phosphoribosylamino)uracil reductase RibD, partial [Candidatus Krumholzibacteria bacterium]|nr:bifunctional diaminohydroxyphosphoribosylaminopyrimidine deaminase/5-amino-6-(5-phosphoribosylamino)uracil reductase RibD [Candidatus Krumholzibacteria bacterium]